MSSNLIVIKQTREKCGEGRGSETAQGIRGDGARVCGVVIRAGCERTRCVRTTKPEKVMLACGEVGVCVYVCCQFSSSQARNCFRERVGTSGEGVHSQLFHGFGGEGLSLSPVPCGCWAVCWMEKSRSQESCLSTGALQGRPLAEAPQGCKCAVGLKGSELQVPAPAWVGFQAPSCVHALSRVPARSCVLTCMHICPWLSSFTCTLSICFSVLSVATVISLSFSLCSLGCFAASYFRMSLFIPFDNKNIRAYVQGLKVPALCRYIRKDPSKPACWREKVLTVSLLPGLAEAKGLIVK